MVNLKKSGSKSGSQKNLDWLASQPIQIWNKKQKRGLVNDLDLLKKEFWSAHFAKKNKNTKKLITAGTHCKLLKQV